MQNWQIITWFWCIADINFKFYFINFFKWLQVICIFSICQSWPITSTLWTGYRCTHLLFNFIERDIYYLISSREDVSKKVQKLIISLVFSFLAGPDVFCSLSSRLVFSQLDVLNLNKSKNVSGRPLNRSFDPWHCILLVKRVSPRLHNF